MTTDQWATLLVYVAVPAANLFPLLYMLTAPWSRSWAGRAVVVSKVGLALLVDAALLFRLHGNRDYAYHDQLVLSAFGLIVVGTYLYLFAFAREQYHKRHGG